MLVLKGFVLRGSFGGAMVLVDLRQTGGREWLAWVGGLGVGRLVSTMGLEDSLDVSATGEGDGALGL